MAARKTLENFQAELSQKLSYPYLNNLDTETFKLLGVEIFTELDVLRRSSSFVDREKLNKFVNNLFYQQSEYFFEGEIYEVRFSLVTEDIIGFSTPPTFWSTSLDVFLKKWDYYFTVENL
ncbi:hypothetical protein FLLO111716_09875 [Flavobacterium longum]|uniref:hypothetical protein n=1 Tax=Flavobacterium longum TaxID=1299340 RepID=UPI0039ED2A98